MYLLQGRYESALTQFEEVKQQDALNVEAAIATAVTHQLQQNYMAAIQEVQTVIARESEHQIARFILGNIYISQKGFQDAVEQFQQLKNPSFLESQLDVLKLRSFYGDQSDVAASRYSLGMLCVLKKWYPSAQNEYSTALWRTPNNPLLSYAMGNIYFLLDDYQRTIETYENVLKLEPGFVYVHKMLGDLYQKRKESEKAISAYQTYLNKHPEDVTVRVLLGMVYEQQGDQETALKEYTTAFELQPENPLILNQLPGFMPNGASSLNKL